MSEAIEPTTEEAKQILDGALRKVGSSLEAHSTIEILNALAGVVNVIVVMQSLGWRVVRPLRAVK